jgi:ubiquinone/menaquinone biosynthesis C-methylase UbiE
MTLPSADADDASRRRNRSAHWQRQYATRAPTAVGWYEADPSMSRRLVAEALQRGARSVIDVGGGASSLVDHLVDEGIRVAVLDIAEAGLTVARERLGDRAEPVLWIVADVTTADDIGRFDVWHDRAVFHFLTEPEDRAAYVALAARTIEAGGTALVATFAPDGPERCSGLPVRRYDAAALARELGPAFRLEASEPYLHVTPSGVQQSFVYSRFTRLQV